MNSSVAHFRPGHADGNAVALPLARLAAAGLLVGALDFVSCSLYWAARDVAPARIARSLAELAIGADAYAPGGGAVAIGLLVEAAIGMALVLGYLGIAAMRPRVHDRAVRSGMAYGALAFACFQWVVIPLSAATPRTPGLEWQFVLLAIHMLVLGIPTALLARRVAVEDAPRA